MNELSATHLTISKKDYFECSVHIAVLTNLQQNNVFPHSGKEENAGETAFYFGLYYPISILPAFRATAVRQYLFLCIIIRIPIKITDGQYPVNLIDWKAVKMILDIDYFSAGNRVQTIYWCGRRKSSASLSLSFQFYQMLVMEKGVKWHSKSVLLFSQLLLVINLWDREKSRRRKTAPIYVKSYRMPSSYENQPFSILTVSNIYIERRWKRFQKHAADKVHFRVRWMSLNQTVSFCCYFMSISFDGISYT